MAAPMNPAVPIVSIQFLAMIWYVVVINPATNPARKK